MTRRTPFYYPYPCVLCGDPAREGHHIDRPKYHGRRRWQSTRRVPVCTTCHRAIHRIADWGGSYARGPNGEDLEAIWESGVRV